MVSVRYLYSVLVVLLLAILPGKLLGQQCTYNVIAPHIVNGVENTQMGISNYYVGYGDTLYDIGMGSAHYYIDNGGYLEYNSGGGHLRVANYGTVNFITSGGLDSSYRDVNANIIGIGGLYLCSPMIFNITYGSSVDSFTVHAESSCAGPTITLNTQSYSSNMIAVLDFGDGTSPVNTIVQSNGMQGYTQTTHSYANAGNYQINQKLYIGSIAVDSAIFPYVQDYCSQMPIQLYHDMNGNCVFENGVDSTLKYPIIFQVDSNGVVVDSISAINGIDYISHGVTGDIYTFIPLSLPGDMSVTCPMTGYITDTFEQGVKPVQYMGLYCPSISNFDLSMQIESQAGTHLLESKIYPLNPYCSSQSATITMNYNMAYTVIDAEPPPSSQGPGVAVWQINNVSADFLIPYIDVKLDGASFATGVPITTTYSIFPAIGDQNPGNNNIVVVDTTVGGWDPNAIYVTLQKCLDIVDTLEYTITFENLGNGVAEHVYILDTLSPMLYDNYMKMEFASHQMNIQKRDWGDYVIVKFDFPNIMLADSSDHKGRCGMLKYKIPTDPYVYCCGWGIGQSVGIYFDYNEPVLTNTVYTGSCVPISVAETKKEKQNITIYPNPATEELTIKTEQSYIVHHHQQHRPGDDDKGYEWQRIESEH